eukprot:CAMPEP_0172312920 /NCGR_PEP_ID=MMETSP1058-20130122/18812_1 /TAXON_ID=83371 /ORGANISM="Detonula confervacea, Strain CCMP 353" /LENGTH=298 /DNA_ID=CAMNT_0013026487 /DNA_START=102 /DNA_END=998 /DNA_ORIENTATION=-
METHYNSHSASSYESAFFYSEDEYMKFLCERTRDKLGISSSVEDNKEETNKNDVQNAPRRRLLDIGGGTGNFTRMLTKNDSLLDAAIIDPFLSSSIADADDDEESDPKMRFVKAGAEEFKSSPDSRGTGDLLPWWRANYDLVLLKEVVHHLPLSDRVDIFRGIHGLVDDRISSASTTLDDASSSSFLIITRPARDIDYPLWPAALEVWAQNQPSVESLEEDLIAAGFQNVSHTIEVYECETELARWLDMIQQRFWSTFSEFTDLELKEACDQIARVVVVDEAGKIKFEDRLVFITACK